MAADATTGRRTQCPECGKKSKRVSPVTLRALLQEEYADGIEAATDHSCEAGFNGRTDCQPVTEETGWRFCDSQDCNVVYFAEEGDTAFTKSQLKVAVGVKETAGERPLCYCFGHSVASIKDDLRTKGRSDTLEDIRQKMKDPGCRCEIENPSGACCLGSVTKGIQVAQEELEMSGTEMKTLATPKPTSEKSAPLGSKPSTGRGEKIAQFGTLVSAVVASSCCWLPLLLLAVGLSGAGIAATLEAYRPLFIAVTFGFLGAAFYFTYRPRKAWETAGGNDGCCAPARAETKDCCAPAAAGRKRWLSVRSLNKAMLWVVTVLAVAFLFFPSYAGLLLGTNGGDGAAVAADMNQAVLKIEGMTCEGCAAVAEKAIRDVPGVLAVEVSYQKGEAVVGAEACCPVPKDEILAALKEVGYTGTIVREKLIETARPLDSR